LRRLHSHDQARAGRLLFWLPSVEADVHPIQRAFSGVAAM
jgi:hypothetical protein